MINFLLTSLAQYGQRNTGPRSFCTNPYGLGLCKKDLGRYFSVQSSRSVSKKLVITEPEATIIVLV
jgi:hypothetical protein